MITNYKTFKLDYMSLLIKPTHRCNMNCYYCYDKINRDNIENDMTMETVKKIAQMADNTAKNITWIWHGGEFLILGKEWISEAVDVVNNILKNRVSFSCQTNGLLLSEDMSQFLEEKKIFPGVSFDGVVHEQTRGNFKKIREILFREIKNNKKIGIITVMDVYGIEKIFETVKLLKEMGLSYTSFNWVFPQDSSSDSEKFTGSLERYLMKFKEFFHFWLFDKEGFMERTCESIVKGLLNNKDTVCSFSGCTGKWLGVDPNGDFLPCDRYYPSRYKMGNIHKDYNPTTDSFFDVFKHNNFIRLKAEVGERRIYCMENCEFYENCSGGCNGSSILTHGTASKVRKEYCYLMKGMLIYAFELLKDLSNEDLLKLNPNVYKLLMKLNYVGLSDIREVVGRVYLQKGEMYEK